MFFFFFSSRRRHTRWPRDWSSDVCSSDLEGIALIGESQLGPVAGQHAGDPPRDRTVVGNAHDEATLACHQRPGLSHILVRHDVVPLAISAGPALDDKPPTCPLKTPALR